MTRSSPQRIAKRAGNHVFTVDSFPRPPAGMIAEQIDLPAFELVLGIVHPEDSPMLIVAWNGKGFQRMLPEQASQWADDLVASGHAVQLAPVIEAIRKLVRRVGDIVSEAIVRKLEVEGQA